MKKRLFLLALLLSALAFPVSACAEGKTLVACFSATGNTAALAQRAAELLNADYYEIVPEIPYTDEDISYMNDACRANREQSDKSCRPAIAEEQPDLSEYDAVLIAHPIWWSEEPRIIDTFMESHDFNGKALAEFCTSGSSGIDAAARHIQAYTPGSRWLGAKRFPADTSVETLQTWLEEIGINQPSEDMTMKIKIGKHILTVRLADNASARALTVLLENGPLTIPASNYGGFEKVCSLGSTLPSDDVQTTAQPGDVMLYIGSKIVLFHGTNDWAYTRLGWIDGLSAEELREILAGPDAEITLSRN